MRKPLLIAGCVFLAAGVGVPAWRALAPREPSYGGKALSEWLACLDGTKADFGSAGQAVFALRAMGTNSFPWLAKMIRTTDPAWKQLMMVLNRRQSVLRFPVTPASLRRARAVEGYALLGSRATQAVPNLIHMLETEASPQVRACIETALGAIGPGAKAAIPALEKATADPNLEVKHNAVLALANIEMFELGAPRFRILR